MLGLVYTYIGTWPENSGIAALADTIQNMPLYLRDVYIHDITVELSNEPRAPLILGYLILYCTTYILCRNNHLCITYVHTS